MSIRGGQRTLDTGQFWAPLERKSKALWPLCQAEGTAQLTAGPGRLSRSLGRSSELLALYLITRGGRKRPWWHLVPHPKIGPQWSSPHPKIPRTKQGWQLAGPGLSPCHCSHELLRTELRL